MSSPITVPISHETSLLFSDAAQRMRSAAREAEGIAGLRQVWPESRPVAGVVAANAERATAFERAKDRVSRAGWAGPLNAVVDVAILLGVLGQTAMMRGTPLFSSVTSAAIAGVFVASWLLAAGLLRYYDNGSYYRSRAEDAAAASMLTLVALGFQAIGGYVLGTTARSSDLPFFLIVAWPAIVLVRWTCFRRLASGEAPVRDALIVGSGPLARCTGEDLERARRRKVVGYVAVAAEEHGGERVLGSLEQLENILRIVHVSEVYMAADPVKHADEIRRAVGICEQLGVPFAVPACAFPLARARAAAVHALSDGYVHYEMVAPKPHQMAAKRLIDILLAAGTLLLLLPSFLLLAALVKLTSRGPVFFRQRRAGLYGKPFMMLKFRSMVADADMLKDQLLARNERTGPVFKISGDPRVTKLGRFMRKYSIDELPQLINVLRGEMSLVGPRPPVPREVDEYEPWQLRRLSMRPGLTCSWQARVDRYRISFEEWMYLDLEYIDRWTLMTDFRLIFRTVPAVFLARGGA